MGATRHVRWRLLVLAALVSVILLPSMATAEQQRARLSATPQPTILVGAGDIASCASDGDEATAALVANIPGQVFTAGDNAYDNGSAKNYANCYDPSWGAFKDRTRPTAGNHEYNTPDAEPYFDYFGAAARPRGLGYYSYDLDRYWHIVVLNSNCAEVGGCDAASAQYAWLANDLRPHPRKHFIAIWHHPRYNSGSHGNNQELDPFWDLLYTRGAEIVISGHAHDYERFAPLDDHGDRDDVHGIREFVTGTGGRNLVDVGTPKPNSEVLDNSTFGVLQLSLYPDHYEWQFIPVPGGAFSDSGSAFCHGNS
jgi:acid phosphatase type 7